jgi:alpha-L-fucosidase
VRELLTNYGQVDVLFFDGVAEGLKQLAWQLQPNVLVTRGDMATPEQELPDRPLPGPWEACFTLGTQWAYKPTNEVYKSGTQLIEMLVETRAKGGNLLLNVGPKPDGEFPLNNQHVCKRWHYGSLRMARPSTTFSHVRSSKNA